MTKRRLALSLKNGSGYWWLAPRPPSGQSLSNILKQIYQDFNAKLKLCAEKTSEAISQT